MEAVSCVTCFGGHTLAVFGARAANPCRCPVMLYQQLTTNGRLYGITASPSFTTRVPKVELPHEWGQALCPHLDALVSWGRTLCARDWRAPAWTENKVRALHWL